MIITQNSVSQWKWFAKIDANGIQYIQKNDGTKIIHRVESKKQFDEQFTNEEELLLSEESKNYKEALERIINEESSKEHIAKIKGEVSFDGQERPLILDREIFEHIFKRHGDFILNNLLETANNPDHIIKNVRVRDEVKKDKINLLKQLSSGKILLIGADRQNWYFILTHIEIVWEGAMDKLLSKWNRVF